jgi:hypothetical protein
MADELIKVELELPSSQVHIETVKPQAPAGIDDESEQAKLEKTRKIMDEESPRRRLQKLKDELMASRRAKDDASVRSNPATGLLKPLEALPLKDRRPPNRHQKLLVGAGLAIAIAGLLLWPLTSFGLAILISAAGAVLVAAGAFVRV